MKALWGILGLAMRAGAIVNGVYACGQAIKGGKARLVLYSKMLSGRSQKELMDGCKYYQVPYACLNDEGALGDSVGKYGKKCIAVTDAQWALRIVQELQTLREPGDVEGEGLCPN